MAYNGFVALTPVFEHSGQPADGTLSNDEQQLSSETVYCTTASDANANAINRSQKVVTQPRRSSVTVKVDTEDRKDLENARLMMEVDELKQQLKDKNSALERSSVFVRSLLLKQCDDDWKRNRIKCTENRLRLGQFVSIRQGGAFTEQWQEGQAFRELQKAANAIGDEREDIERKRKLLVKSKRLSAVKNNRTGTDTVSMCGGTDSSTTTTEMMELEEIYKLRLLNLKKQESELQTELAKLERERNVHIADLRRLQNEDMSQYNNHPVMDGRYTLLSLLGRGGFSEVYKSFDQKELRFVACKLHQLDSSWNEQRKANYVRHALRERDIQKQLYHPHIIQLFDVFEIDRNTFCTVLEYCDGCDLDFHLKQNKILCEKEAHCIIMQTVSALKYLNEINPPIIHYDLKPGNILLDKIGHVKISDFGLSKIMDNCCDMKSGIELTSQFAGTYWYLPPECFVVGSNPPKISSKVDVWSLGIIFFQCLYGHKPFGHHLAQSDILAQQTILHATSLQFPAKPPISNEAKDFISLCLSYKKEHRPEVLTIAQHEYLRTAVPATKIAK